MTDHQVQSTAIGEKQKSHFSCLFWFFFATPVILFSGICFPQVHYVSKDFCLFFFPSLPFHAPYHLPDFSLSPAPFLSSLLFDLCCPLPTARSWLTLQNPCAFQPPSSICFSSIHFSCMIFCPRQVFTSHSDLNSYPLLYFDYKIFK